MPNKKSLKTDIAVKCTYCGEYHDVYVTNKLFRLMIYCPEYGIQTIVRGEKGRALFRDMAQDSTNDTVITQKAG